MTLLLDPTAAAAEALRPALGDPVVVDTPALLRRALAEGEHDLVVVGPDADLGLALELASTERVARPWLGVVLVRRRVDSAVLAEAMRHGVREVVKGDDLAAVADACRRSQELSRQVRAPGGGRPARGTGTVTTVFGAKGGCGKTTLATNLAVALAEDRERRVCLVDLDLAFGDVAISLGLDPVRTVADAVGLSRLDETAVASIVTRHGASRVDALLAPVEPGTAETVPAGTVADLLRLLAGMYDHVVVDTPTALDEKVLAALDQSASVVLVTTLDLPAVKTLKLTLETLAVLSYPADRLLVALNRADAKVGITPGDVEAAIGRRVDVRVPSSRAVPTSVNRGVPLAVDSPGHVVSATLRRFAAERLVPRPAQPATSRRARRLLRAAGATS